MAGALLLAALAVQAMVGHGPAAEAEITLGHSPCDSLTGEAHHACHHQALAALIAENRLRGCMAEDARKRVHPERHPGGHTTGLVRFLGHYLKQMDLAGDLVAADTEIYESFACAIDYGLEERRMERELNDDSDDDGGYYGGRSSSSNLDVQFYLLQQRLCATSAYAGTAGGIKA